MVISHLIIPTKLGSRKYFSHFTYGWCKTYFCKNRLQLTSAPRPPKITLCAQFLLCFPLLEMYNPFRREAQPEEPSMGMSHQLQSRERKTGPPETGCSGERNIEAAVGHKQRHILRYVRDCVFASPLTSSALCEKLLEFVSVLFASRTAS